MKEKKIRFSKDNKVEVKYSLYRSLERKQWEVWKIVSIANENVGGGVSSKAVFEGTEKQCKEYIRKLEK